MKDYWAFDAILETFTRNAGKRAPLATCFHGGLYRVKPEKPGVSKAELLVLRPPRNWDMSSILDVFPEIPEERIRSFGFGSIPDWLKHFADGFTYGAPKGWKPTNSARRAQRKAEREGYRLCDEPPTQEELLVLLPTWSAWARTRHAQVSVGHYAEMIADPRFRFLAYRDAEGKLVASLGYVVQDGEGCVGFCKHLPGLWWLGHFVWASGVERILGEASSVQCGDTADAIKQQVGFARIPMRRLYYRRMIRTPIETFLPQAPQPWRDRYEQRGPNL